MFIFFIFINRINECINFETLELYFYYKFIKNNHVLEENHFTSLVLLFKILITLNDYLVIIDIYVLHLPVIYFSSYLVPFIF